MANNIAIETLIGRSLEDFLNIGEENNIQKNAESWLIFPKYYHGNNEGQKRMSEQELRFLLVRKLEEAKIFYSVEAPTKKKYVFTGENENSRSGLIDLCLYDSEGKRTTLIELKHKGGISEISKDLEKLLFDLETEWNYFIHLDSSKSKKITDIEAEYKSALKEALENSSESRQGEKIIASVKIFLFVIREETLYECEINKDGILGTFSKSKKEVV
jgi:hypothetical protein